MEEHKNGKTALITGASSGIGQELTRLFAKDGYNLVLVGRNQESLEQLAANFHNQYGTQTTILIKDLANTNAPEEIYAETQEKGIQVDVLVNDAGFGEYGQFATETDLQKELSIIQVNATALVHLTKLYLNDMVSRNEGKILMLGSEVSVIPNPMMAVYGATKAFIKSFSEAVRNEIKNKNVTITVLMPGATNTNFFNVAGATDVKGADPQKTANPADVAKEGYEALMKGKDHVVAGWMNKARVAVSHMLPDPLLAAAVRRDMTPKEQAEEDQKNVITIAVLTGALVLGGIWLLSKKRSGIDMEPVNAYNRAHYRQKAKAAKKSAKKKLETVSDAVKDTYKKAKTAVEEELV